MGIVRLEQLHMKRRGWLAGVSLARVGAVIVAMTACGPKVPTLGPAVPTPASLPTAAATALAAAPLTATPAASPTPDCSGMAGGVVQDSYPGMLVEGQVPFRVYLPPCADLSDVRLPVLYLFHGYPFDETQWDDLGIDELAEAWIQAGQAPPFAVVMPRLPEPLFRSSDGGPWSYEAEMLGGLLPAVEAEYPVSNAPEKRAIAGISRGGVWSLEIGMRHPEAFGTVAAFSPALSVNNARPEFDPLVLAEAAGGLPPRFFVAAGEDDWARPQSERLAAALQAQGKEVKLVIPSGSHDSTAWLGALQPFLTYVLEGWEG